jgi:hypothetical protein
MRCGASVGARFIAPAPGWHADGGCRSESDFDYLRRHGAGRTEDGTRKSPLALSQRAFRV